jgi:pimeloyl-ACP methyl ester carboxylesterase
VLAIRGTEDLVEFLDDLTAIAPVPFPGFGGNVGDGFYSIYRTLRVVYPSHQDLHALESPEMEGTFAEQVATAISRHSAHPEKQIVVTGHSLGAALATLYVAENAVLKNARGGNITLICAFAAPLVGDSDFVSRFDNLPVASWLRILLQQFLQCFLAFGRNIFMTPRRRRVGRKGASTT